MPPPLIMQITGKTELYGCIAHPVGHVRAPMIFNNLFNARNIDAVMLPINIAPEQLATAIAGLKALGNFKGAAVTIPFKMAIADLCDELGPGARAAQAVNAIAFGRDGRLYGDNFDGEGFVAGLLAENPKQQAKEAIFGGRNILVCGAGGAARAVLLALAHQNTAKIDVLNRTKAHADEAVMLTKKQVSDAPLHVVIKQQINFAGYDMIINASALGLQENDPLPLDLDRLRADCLICDIIMIPEKTKLIRAAEASGRPYHLGRHMLDYQIEMIGQFIGAF